MNIVINEWDMHTLPYVFYQYNNELYTKIETTVIKLYKTNKYICIDYLFKLFKKSDVKQLNKLYSYDVIIDKFKYLILYMIDDGYVNIYNDRQIFSRLILCSKLM